MLDLVNEVTHINSNWADDRYYDAKNGLKQIIIFGLLFLVILLAVCFGIMYLRFIVFGG